MSNPPGEMTEDSAKKPSRYRRLLSWIWRSILHRALKPAAIITVVLTMLGAIFSTIVAYVQLNPANNLTIIPIRLKPTEPRCLVHTQLIPARLAQHSTTFNSILQNQNSQPASVGQALYFPGLPQPYGQETWTIPQQSAFSQQLHTQIAPEIGPEMEAIYTLLNHANSGLEVPQSALRRVVTSLSNRLSLEYSVLQDDPESGREKDWRDRTRSLFIDHVEGFAMDSIYDSTGKKLLPKWEKWIERAQSTYYMRIAERQKAVAEALRAHAKDAAEPNVVSLLYQWQRQSMATRELRVPANSIPVIARPVLVEDGVIDASCGDNTLDGFSITAALSMRRPEKYVLLRECTMAVRDGANTYNVPVHLGAIDSKQDDGEPIVIVSDTGFVSFEFGSALADYAKKRDVERFRTLAMSEGEYKVQIRCTSFRHGMLGGTSKNTTQIGDDYFTFRSMDYQPGESALPFRE